MSDQAGLTLVDAARLIAQRQISSRELTDACLGAIDEWEPKVEALLAQFDDEARMVAASADEASARGESWGRLHGVPVVIKDVIDVAGKLTTAGSRVLADHIANRDADSVAALRGEGAIILGKSNTHEFAYGAITPPTSNPWDTTRIPGGSSGGSAVAVATGMAFGALGTDTLGSIREPASFCSVVGFKPTYGQVSNFGVIPLAESFDTVGPMARSVEDCELLYRVMTGSVAACEARGSEVPSDRPRFGIPSEAIEVLQSEVRRTFFDAVNRVAPDAQEVSLGDLDEISDVAHRIIEFEAARFHRDRYLTTPELYGEDVAERIAAGLEVPDWRYRELLVERAQILKKIHELFDQVDFLVLPSAMVTAPAKTAGSHLVVDQREFTLGKAVTRLLAPFSLAGVPAISLPAGFDSAGLPIGLQLAGAPGQDRQLLAVAAEIHRALGWAPMAPIRN